MPTLRRESVEGGMAGPLHLKVFLSSPSDVAEASASSPAA